MINGDSVVSGKKGSKTRGQGYHGLSDSVDDLLNEGVYPVLQFFKKDSSSEEIKIKGQYCPSPGLADESRIICRHCGNHITSVEEIITVQGSHRHVFTNPAGLVFEIGCFSTADGCLVSGIPTREFTWFSGYSWNYAHCGNCLTHLGWFYQNRDSSFFGLILERLIETSTTH
ncbi:MAG TPA: hypothetical protein ENK09_10365 [Nitrospirae bacterium]|nr:hypothetical protein [Nitrospirota bacterium]